MLALTLLVALAQASDPYVLVRGDPMNAPGLPVRRAVAPVFPGDLRTTPAGEAIEVEVETDLGGQVTRLRVIAGDAVPAQQAAMRAARHWHFRGAGIARLVFVFRSIPADASLEELATVFRGPYEVEVRRAISSVDAKER